MARQTPCRRGHWRASRDTRSRSDGRLRRLGARHEGGCGNGVGLYHYIASPKGSRYTVYCHLEAIAVSTGQQVNRGDLVGRVGTTGDAGDVPHVHLEVSLTSRTHSDGDLSETEDPEPYFAGCFDPKRPYPTGQFSLTYPIRCTPP